MFPKLNCTYIIKEGSDTKEIFVLDKGKDGYTIRDNGKVRYLPYSESASIEIIEQKKSGILLD